MGLCGGEEKIGEEMESDKELKFMECVVGSKSCNKSSGKGCAALDPLFPLALIFGMLTLELESEEMHGRLSEREARKEEGGGMGGGSRGCRQRS